MSATTVQIDASVNNIATTFGSGAGSKMGPFKAGEVLVVNSTIEGVIWLCPGDSSTPSSSVLTANTFQIYVASSAVSPGFSVPFLTSNNQYYYVRSDSGTLNAGKLTVTVL